MDSVSKFSGNKSSYLNTTYSFISINDNGWCREPNLILDRTASPHRYSLSPKKAKQTQEADIIFWVGPYIETFLIKPINNLNKKNINIQISKLPNLTTYKIRSGDGFEEHDHDHGHHDDHDDHKAHRSRRPR